ncbi:MAG TPA: hypothetical protein VN033_10600 [Vulgatibacter sp.]|nr:hypothetical protein [Vulgatibacter sp.]
MATSDASSEYQRRRSESSAARKPTKPAISRIAWEASKAERAVEKGARIACRPAESAGTRIR